MTPESDADARLVRAVADKMHEDADFARELLNAVGSFADIETAPWRELTPGQQAVRRELAVSDRTGLRLGSVQEVYDALSAAGRMSGKYLRLGHGPMRVTVIGLDAARRRWLRMRPTAAAAEAAAAETDPRKVRSVLSRAGSVTASWSVYRSELVPPPGTVLRYLPVPDGGCLLCVIAGGPDVLAKERFREAVARLCAGAPVSDVLFWDGQVLWTVRGGFGHSEEADAGLPESLAPFAEELRGGLMVPRRISSA